MKNTNPQYIFCKTQNEFEQARILFKEYAASLGFDLCFQGFEEELAQLNSKYAYPDGALLLAILADQPIGCVGIRKLEDGSAELKRLYVKPAYRKLKIGEELMYLGIQEAKNLGYPSLKLDTLASFKPAVSLYKKLGFKEIPAYNYNPFQEVLYMELNLDFPTTL